MTGKSILLADESPTIRRVVQLTLADSGVRLEAVGSAAEALSRLDMLRPDLVLADVRLPGPGGYELCRQIKDSPRPVPVLLLSGYFEGGVPEQARACGADGHLAKPFDTRALVATVRALLERQAPAAGPAPAPSGEAPEVPLPEIGAACAPPVPAEPEAGTPAESPVAPAQLEALAAAVARRLVGPLASEIARELEARGLEPRRG
jgi:CheY-like chemotaxis protein